MYQRKVNVDMLNAVKSVLASETFQALALCQNSDKGQSGRRAVTLETSANTLFTVFSISITSNKPV